MKLNQKQRGVAIRSLKAAIRELHDDGLSVMRFGSTPSPSQTKTLIRISRVISNLNGVAWPE